MRLFNLNKRSPYFHVVVYGLMFIVFANVAVCVWYVIGQKQYQSTIDTSGEIESYGPINLRISSSSFNVLPATLHVHKKDSHFEHDSESHKSSKDGSHIAESDRFSADDKSVHRNLPPCPLMPPGLQGTVYVETKARFTFEEIQQKHNNTLIGGRHKPLNCTSNNRVAIIVPYRNRKHHLLLFLNHMHLFLQRQQLDYGIFVVELAPTVRFNRALLMNIGFVEASRHYGYDCFIFHDVDLLPENDWNLYTCSQQSPKHLSVAINKFDYSLPYMTLFGGVSAMTRDQFQLLNGYSNKYFGWGGEDDDMFNRVNASHMVLLRYTPDVARYQMLEHNQDGKNPSRKALLRSGFRRWKTDGLNSLEYTVLAIDRTPLYTYVLADINVSNSAFVLSSADIEFQRVTTMAALRNLGNQLKTVSIVVSFFLISIMLYKYFTNHCMYKS